jgi:hypothetical protein
MIPHAKTNSRWIKDFELQNEAIKVLKEKHGEIFL